MEMSDFIDQNRARFTAEIRQTLGESYQNAPVSDEEIEMWISNVEEWYLEAKKEGVEGI